MASVMPELPDSTTGQPAEWAMRVKNSPKALVRGEVNRAIEWADTPASRALARSDSNRLTRTEAGRSPGRPNRARGTGWRGTERSGARMASPIDPAFAASGANSRR